MAPVVDYHPDGWCLLRGVAPGQIDGWVAADHLTNCPMKKAGGGAMADPEGEMGSPADGMDGGRDSLDPSEGQSGDGGGGSDATEEE